MGFALPYLLGVWGERCEFPVEVRGGAPAAQRFSYILSALSGVSCCILGALILP